MKIIYPIKIKYKDGVITGLFSPHLRVNFISQYLEATNNLNNEKIPPNILLKGEFLQAVVDNYISCVQSNNYKFRHPDFIQANLIHENDQWVNVQINTQLKKGLSEKTAQVVSIAIFFVSYSLAEGFFALAARMNKIPYKTLILPMLVDFCMSSILYYYSGAASNIIYKGKELDDWLYNRAVSPFEEAESGTSYPLLSTWNLSRTLLCILAISKTTFDSYSFWQSIMAMKKQFEQSNIDDPILTPTFIYNLAVVTIVINAFYETAKLSSFALKATHVLQTFFDNNYNLCSKWINDVRKKHYSEVLITEENTESEVDDIDTRIPGIITTSFNIIKPTRGKANGDEETTMFFITDVIYDNLLLNVQGLLFEVAQIGGAKAVQNIINLGEDYEVASTIIEYIKQYGIKHVMKILFSDAINYKVDVNLSSNQIVAITEDKVTKKYSETLVLLDVEKIASKIIEQNFLLNNEQGREFVQAVANHFDKETLLKILELGGDQDIAEQILIEAEAQGVNMVIFTLLGKKLPAANADIDSLENLIGTQELSQLQLVPNGIFNAWSNKAYYKIVEYIDNLAKNLDNLLNMGKSGSQIAITIVILEEFLGFAASGQRFTVGIPPYYNPDDKDDWAYGYGGSSDGNNNSSEGNFDNHNGFVGLILPVYNGTDYDINHQM